MISASVSNLDRFAEFFGASGAEISSRLLPSTRIDGTRSPFVNFFGLPVRSLYFEKNMRRVAPLSLRQSAHHRGAWLLRPLTFCRESREILISRCPNPVCSKPLGWRRGFGIEFCEHCIDDDSEPTTCISDYQQPLLNREQVGPLCFVAGLIDPDPNLRSESRRLIPPRLERFENWEIFDLAVTLAFIHVRRYQKNAGLRITEAFQLVEWTDSLAAAADAVLGWPDRVKGFLTSLRETSVQRGGFFGRTKEMGHLAQFGRAEGLTPALCDEIRTAVLAEYASEGRPDTRSSYDMSGLPAGYIRFTDACNKYGLGGRYLSALTASKLIEIFRVQGAGRAPVYIRESELVAAIEARNDLLKFSRLRTETCIPPLILDALAKSGFIAIENGPGAQLKGPGPWIRSSEVSNFRAKFNSIADASNVEDVPLRVALRQLGIPGSAMLAVLKACLTGKLRFSLRAGRLLRISDIMVRPSNLLSCSALLSSTPDDSDLPERMTVAEVGLRLDLTPRVVSKLLDADLLKAVPFGTLRQVQGASVLAFELKFITTAAAARLFKIDPRILRRYMADRGHAPAEVVSISAGSKSGGGQNFQITLWLRSALEKLAKCPAPEQPHQPSGSPE